MSENIQSSDSLQPSWAAHELFALALTLVLAVWIVSKYGKEAQPQSLTTERDQARAQKRAELKKADEEALGGYGVLDAGRKVYRVPITDATSPCPDWAASPNHVARSTASPSKRSKNIFGKANVVAWNMREDTAVVRNTMIETRNSKAR